MTTQTNGDEQERKGFENWFNSKFLERIKSYPRMGKIRYKNIAKDACIARSKQEGK